MNAPHHPVLHFASHIRTFPSGPKFNMIFLTIGPTPFLTPPKTMFTPPEVSSNSMPMTYPDLSARHELINDLFQLPDSPEAWRRFQLSPNQIESFHQQGYLAGVRVLSDQQVDALREELSGLFSTNHPGHHLFHEFHSNESPDPSKVLFHALGGWRITPGFHDALWNPAFTVPATQLLGGPVRFWHDQLFCKPAKHGGVVAWHQDYSYWTRTKPMNHLTCWIGLDDSDEKNGCLQYIPGSHRWNLLPITGLAGNMDAIRNVLNDDQWLQMQNPFSIRLKKGEAAFHHPLLVHGSRENSSNRPRRAMVINAFLDGTQSDSNDPLLNGIPPIPKNQKVEGQFFPLLLNPHSVGLT